MDDYIAEQNFLVDTLIEDRNIIRASVMKLESIENLMPHQQEDLDYERNIIDSIQKTLTYYISCDSYEKIVGVPHPYPLD